MRALRQLTTAEVTLFTRALPLLASLVMMLPPSAWAAEQEPAAEARSPEQLPPAQQISPAGPPRQDGSPKSGEPKNPPSPETTAEQTRKGKPSVESFKPTEQIPAGSGVSFPADI